jgi:hypothetical protein
MRLYGVGLGVALATILLSAGCNDYGNTFQVPTGARLVSLSPSNVTAGSPQFTLVVTGVGFVAKTVVQWNGNTIPTTVATDSNGNVTGISATVSASLVASPGKVFVNTFQPHSGAGTNGLSNPLAFIINPTPNPQPVVSSISPSCAVAGGASFTLSVNGSAFLPTSDPSGGSQVQWITGGAQQTLALVGGGSATQLQATVPAGLIASVGSASVAVFNPPASTQGSSGNGGGGTSQNTPAFTVAATSCPAGSAQPASATQTAAEETPAVSADGRFVAYTALQGDHPQVLVRDTCIGAPQGCQARTSLVSVGLDGTAADSDSRMPSMSADGRFVAFSSAATNLVSQPGMSGRQIYLRDTCLGTAPACTASTQLISTDAEGKLGGTESILPSVSSSGRFVAFVAVTASHAKATGAAKSAENTASTSGAGNSGLRQVFVRDTCMGAPNCTPSTSRISLQPGDAPAGNARPAGPALSGSGEHVAIPEAQTLTLLRQATSVDDHVFLALTRQQ